jgi:class 3 adenylate cyclase/ferritin-like metal-binding protein YciE
MSHSKSYDNNKNDVQSKSNLVKDLNEILSVENASIDRIISRIDQTSLQELNRRLKQHLEETYLQKSRLQRIITELGGKPTSAKADLSRLAPPTTIIMKKRSITTAESKKEDIVRDDYMPEEEELVRIKQDRIIEFNELEGYKSLIQTMQIMDKAQQHKITLLLEQSVQEEESMAHWYKIHEPLVIDKLWPKMIHASIRRGQKFLLNHVSSKIPLIIIYVDLVGSTTISMTLSIDKLVDIIRVFVHEISHVVDSYDGYVLKYAGDAVISFFPGRVNNVDKYLASDTSIECGKSMIDVIRETNEIFNKKFGYPELFTKIGIDAGENAIIQYGYDQESPIDILGYSMNIASKITSLTGANKISIGENVYKSLNHKTQREFHELSMPDNKWKYINYGTDRPYKVYTINT